MDAGIGGWIVRHAQQRGDKAALIDGPTGALTTYAELEQRTGDLAASLYHAGVRRGDRIALLSTNSPAFMEAVFAVARLGAILVPLNYRLAADELGYILQDSGAMMLFVSPELTDAAGAALDLPAIPVRRTVVLGPATARFESVDDFVTDEPFHGADVAERDVCMIMYTSGTTGHPKGAMLTHENMLWNAVNMLSAGEGLRRTDVTLSAAPLFHIGALGIFTLPLLYTGGTVATVGQFDPAQTLEIMQREQVTVMFLVPAMWAAVMRTPGVEDFDARHIRCAISGGSPCPLPVIRFFRDKGWRFMEGFGLTETAPVSTVLEADHVTDKAGSIGRPVMHEQCRIVDDADRDVTDDTIGELLIRGPNVFVGYWGKPRETAQALRGGWFYTGDLARRDAEGFISIVDRKKDMVISGGENIYPVEVERVLIEHDAVTDVAVIGVPDDKWGETVMAVIVAESDSSPDPQALIAFCRERLAGYKTPKHVEIVDELPRNATGKLLKRTLRQRFLEQAGRL